MQDLVVRRLRWRPEWLGAENALAINYRATTIEGVAGLLASVNGYTRPIGEAAPDAGGAGHSIHEHAANVQGRTGSHVGKLDWAVTKGEVQHVCTVVNVHVDRHIHWVQNGSLASVPTLGRFLNQL